MDTVQLTGQRRAVLRALTLGLDVRIGYRDASGAVTERVVTPRRCDGGGLHGHCHLRDATRSFHWDQITAVTLLARRPGTTA